MLFGLNLCHSLVVLVPSALYVVLCNAELPCLSQLLVPSACLIVVNLKLAL